jgi:uncharacterized surface protein with fasciclin (FAS1) repeats
MIKSIRLILLAGIFLISYSCKKDIEQESQYKRPDWLAGKLYTQIKAESGLSKFAKCLALTGYDTLLNTSGVYTIFAPNDTAFIQYFQNHPEYKNVEDIPVPELTKIVLAHIIVDPWSIQQLQQLDVYGWIDTTDENNNKPKGFKRETLQVDKNTKYGVVRDEYKNEIIVDTLQTKWYRRRNTDAGKYASVFYKEYFDANGLSIDDYKFYFNRPFSSPSDIFYMGGKIIKGDIFAENGFIHIIDKVIEPIQNTYEILSTKKSKDSYSKFLNLINTFSFFSYNQSKTYSQPGATSGQVVDSLFDISYPALTFDIINEATRSSDGVSLSGSNNLSVRYQNGLVAPTNEALDAFEKEYLVGPNKWGSLSKADPVVKRIIVNTYMANKPIYPSSFQKGYMNGERDQVFLDESTIIQQQYAGNATFIGVNKAIVPRAFKSIVGSVILDTRYLNSYNTVILTGLLPTLKKPGNDYSFFIESDANCRIDSSLIYERGRPETFERTGKTKVSPIYLTLADLRTLLMNHIGFETPKGIGRKEFIRTMGGNYLIVNNQTGEVSGTSSTTIGYHGTKNTQVTPVQISNNTDNGKTYEISNWFSFSSPSIYSKISGSDSLSSFHALLKRAGLVDEIYGRYTFLSNSNFYTVFAPTNSAMRKYKTDTLTTDQLKKFLMMHFVQGDMIFTDGKKLSKYYQTARIDEKSTSYSTVFTKIYISPGVDVINIHDKTGNTYLSIDEKDGTTNIITGYSPPSDTPSAFPAQLSNGVIHQISKVLLVNDLDIN